MPVVNAKLEIVSLKFLFTYILCCVYTIATRVKAGAVGAGSTSLRLWHRFHFIKMRLIAASAPLRICLFVTRVRNCPFRNKYINLPGFEANW
jgi:hypothetical protein